MLETPYREQLQIDLAKVGFRLFRNVVSLLYTKNGTPMKVGIDGQGDLLGYLPVVITKEMVGKKIAVYVSVETKVGRRQGTKEQLAWLKSVNENGGAAVIVRPGDDVAGMVIDKIR